ncbi:MAG: YfcE family phosphodiesterase [Chloroflexota bacterium]|jgi:putative phosphoesterase|nr:YfcE family phosphodiesterase [Chloroflexota bacterium]
MKIGVLSDTHDNLTNLVPVLETFKERGIKTLIHCGDLTSLDMISHFKGFRMIYTIGNMDVATGAIKKRIEKMNTDNFAGMVYRGKLDGVPVAVTHSHIDGKVMELVREQRFKWIFHGHTHEKRDEVVRGVRIVNPGALGGLGREPRSFCIVDLDTEDVEFIQVS